MFSFILPTGPVEVAVTADCQKALVLFGASCNGQAAALLSLLRGQLLANGVYTLVTIMNNDSCDSARGENLPVRSPTKLMPQPPETSAEYSCFWTLASGTFQAMLLD